MHVSGVMPVAPPFRSLTCGYPSRMTRFGYTLMTEQSGPKELVRYAISAEQAGFDFEVSSDHFSPWLVSQGHAPNAWTLWVRWRTPPSESTSTPTSPARPCAITLPSSRSRPRRCRSWPTVASHSASARGRTSTNTLSARAGPRCNAATTCCARRSSSSASCSAATSSTTKVTISKLIPPASGMCPTTR